MDILLIKRFYYKYLSRYSFSFYYFFHLLLQYESTPIWRARGIG